MSNLNSELDVSSSKEIFFDGKEWKVKKTTITQKYDHIRRMFRKIDKKEEILPISDWEPSLKKEIETVMIFKRIATDSNTLLPLQAWFSQKIKIVTDANNPHEYLNEFEGRFFLHHLDKMVTQVLSMTDSRVQKIGKPKRLSNKELKKLLESGTQVYTSRPDGSMILDISP